jgi:hypothetical protein
MPEKQLVEPQCRLIFACRKPFRSRWMPLAVHIPPEGGTTNGGSNLFTVLSCVLHQRSISCGCTCVGGASVADFAAADLQRPDRFAEEMLLSGMELA